MPGLFGFAGKFFPENYNDFLSRMAHALHPEEGYKVNTFYDNEIGLGRITLGLTDSIVQPIWNENRSTCLLMEGEIYDYDGWKRKLIEIGHSFQTNSNAEFVLRLYEEIGEEFVQELNGAYSIVIWNKTNRQLIITNDRLGLRPLYYIEKSDHILFASGLRALFVDQELDKDVDELAIAQLLTFDFILDDLTLLKKVKLLPPASILTFVQDRMDIRSYWTLEFQDLYEPKKESAFLEGLIFHLRQAVTRQSSKDETEGVLLSGGLDSRVITALLSQQKSIDNLHTFTFGIPG